MYPHSSNGRNDMNTLSPWITCYNFALGNIRATDLHAITGEWSVAFFTARIAILDVLQAMPNDSVKAMAADCIKPKAALRLHSDEIGHVEAFGIDFPE